ncbi:MAG: LysM peptidoglycan-binding domain-containing protein [Chloroflexota bacterium]
MVKLPKSYFVLVLLILMVGLTGCELRRDSNAVSDLQPVSELSPTLAPLGAEDNVPAGEATPIPTVINVQPTATESSLQAGEAADSPTELVAPTTQPVDLSTQPQAGNNAAEGAAAVVPETFTPPVEQTESSAAGSVIADATTQDLPDGGPIAANPPTSQTGDYSANNYGETSYTVEPGDTLFSIGLRFGVSSQAIMYANGLISDLIQVGQVLTIPAGDDTGYAAPGYDPGYAPPAYDSGFAGGYSNTHVVTPGETLYRIALQYGVAVDAIAGANAIPYPYLIQVGQELLIPAPGAYAGPPPPPAGGYYQPDPGYYQPAPNEGYYSPQPNQDYYDSAPDSAYSQPGGAYTHTVAPGETLFSIAQGYGLTAEAIAQANGLANPNQIFVGQVLYLP